MLLIKITATVLLICSGGALGFCQSNTTTVPQKYKDRTRKIQIDNSVQTLSNIPPAHEIEEPADPDLGGGGGPGLGYNQVIFPVYKDGYLFQDAITGTMASVYNQFIKVGELTGNKIRQVGDTLYIGTPGPYGLLYTGAKVQINYAWNFTRNELTNWNYYENIDKKGVFKYHFIYHHGYNTRSHWKSVSRLNRFDYGVRLLDTLTNTATQGGNYYRESAPFKFDTIIASTGGTELSYQQNLPLIGKGDCYLEKVELHYCANPSNQINQTISFSQFYETIPSGENVNISLPGVGVFDYGCEFVQGTTSFQNLSVSKHTQVSYMVTYISDSELLQDFGGSEVLFAGIMTNAMSSYMNPYPDKVVVQPNVQDFGAKTYFSAIIQ
jgi:hypothetical protein